MDLLAAALPKDIQEALVVRFTNKTNMFGQTYKDPISQAVETHESRYSVQVHPYPWLAADASNVIIHKNMYNELFVALVYNQRRSPANIRERLPFRPAYTTNSHPSFYIP